MLPPELVPRLREAAKKVNFDWDKDFSLTDNTCTEMTDGERTLLREKFAGNAVIQTEKQVQAAAVRVRGNAVNSAKKEVGQAEIALEELGAKAVEFEKEAVKDAIMVEEVIVKDVVKIEEEIVKDVVKIEKEIVKDIQEVEKEIVGVFRKN